MIKEECQHCSYWSDIYILCNLSTYAESEPICERIKRYEKKHQLYLRTPIRIKHYSHNTGAKDVKDINKTFVMFEDGESAIFSVHPEVFEKKYLIVAYEH